MNPRCSLALSICISLTPILAGCAANRAGPSPSITSTTPPRWYEPEIQAFEAADRLAPPPPRHVLFIGSSSIRMWSSLARDMAPVSILNRGFGGSKTPEVLAVFDRIVAPYSPHAIVCYCGDNDLGTDNSNAIVPASGFIQFDARARSLWPSIQTFYIAIKPSLARWNNWPAMQQANDIVRRYCESTPGATFLDIATPMLGPDGRPNPALFLQDGLHLNDAGYAVWTSVVRPAVLQAWNAPAP